MIPAPRSRTTRLTVEAFAALPEEEGYRLELSRGRLVREPAPGPRHGNVAGRLFMWLSRWGDEGGLGCTFVGTAFVLPSVPETVRVPDVAFVSRERLPEEGLTDRWWEVAPDLVVEVLSPSNTASEMQEKVREYLTAGVRLVWIVDPRRETIAVHRAGGETRILASGETLEGGEVLPELRLPVEEVFA